MRRPTDVALATLPDAQPVAEDGLPRLIGVTPVAGPLDASRDDPCAITLALQAAPDAMVNLALAAPCNPDQRVVIRHADLSFTARTDAGGQLSALLPALQSPAVVATYLDTNKVVLAEVPVPDLADHLRFAVQLPYPAQFDLTAQAGGQVLTLGSSRVAQPLLAQVFSAPVTASHPDLTVALRVTAELCGRTIAAETVLSRGGSAAHRITDVVIPLCDTSDDILLLKNLAPDLTLATLD